MGLRDAQPCAFCTLVVGPADGLPLVGLASGCAREPRRFQFDRKQRPALAARAAERCAFSNTFVHVSAGWDAYRLAKLRSAGAHVAGPALGCVWPFQPLDDDTDRRRRALLGGKDRA